MAWSARQTKVGGTLFLANDVANAGDTSAVGFSSDTLTGSLLVLCVWGNGFSPSTSPTPAPTLTPNDSRWLFAGTETGNDSGAQHTSTCVSMYYIPNAPIITTSTTFTVHASIPKGQLSVGFCLYEITGAPASVAVQSTQVANSGATANTNVVTPNLVIPAQGAGAVIVIAATSQQLTAHGATYTVGPLVANSFDHYQLNVTAGNLSTSFATVSGYWSALAVAFGFTRVQITGGNFQDALGNPLANGTVTFKLSTDAVASDSQVVAGILTSAPLDSGGNISGTVLLWPNDQLTPITTPQPSVIGTQTTIYRIKAYSAAGQLAWQSENVIPSGSGICDLGSLTPLF